MLWKIRNSLVLTLNLRKQCSSDGVFPGSLIYIVEKCWLTGHTLWHLIPGSTLNCNEEGKWWWEKGSEVKANTPAQMKMTPTARQIGLRAQHRTYWAFSCTSMYMCFWVMNSNSAHVVAEIQTWSENVCDRTLQQTVTIISFSSWPAAYRSRLWMPSAPVPRVHPCRRGHVPSLQPRPLSNAQRPALRAWSWSGVKTPATHVPCSPTTWSTHYRWRTRTTGGVNTTLHLCYIIVGVDWEGHWLTRCQTSKTQKS